MKQPLIYEPTNFFAGSWRHRVCRTHKQPFRQHTTPIEFGKSPGSGISQRNDPTHGVGHTTAATAIRNRAYRRGDDGKPQLRSPSWLGAWSGREASGFNLY